MVAIGTRFRPRKVQELHFSGVKEAGLKKKIKKQISERRRVYTSLLSHLVFHTLLLNWCRTVNWCTWQQHNVKNKNNIKN